MRNLRKANSESKLTPAVVMPSDRPASLGIARLLGRRGIPVYGVDSDPRALAMYSRYLTPCPIPSGERSPDLRLESLLALGEKLGEAVLYPVSDDDVLLVSENREQLQRYYQFVMPDQETLAKVVKKDSLHQLATQFQIPCPQMFLAGSIADVEEIVSRLPYPVILKPSFSPSWLRDEIMALVRENFVSGPSKVVFCENAEKLIQVYRKIAVYDPQMIIEEVIPGEDERLSYFCFYLDQQSRPLATFAGKKIRVLPVGFGSATYVRSFYDRELEEISLKLLAGIQYKGLGGVEFKKDPRDGMYKLIEFNARMGMWDSLGARCGIDIPYISYCDALGIKVEPQSQYRSGVLWIDLQRDIRAYLVYHHRKQLSFSAWLRSLGGEKDWAFYTRDDWAPAVISYWQIVQRQIKKH